MQLLAVIAHFVYGIAWAVILYALFESRTNIARALGLAVIVQWLLLMQLMYLPIIGWGVFGAASGSLPPDAPLALTSQAKYIAPDVHPPCRLWWAEWLVNSVMGRQRSASGKGGGMTHSVEDYSLVLVFGS